MRVGYRPQEVAVEWTGPAGYAIKTYKNPQLREVFPSALELSQENGVFLSQSEWKMDGIGP